MQQFCTTRQRNFCLFTAPISPAHLVAFGTLPSPPGWKKQYKHKQFSFSISPLCNIPVIILLVLSQMHFYKWERDWKSRLSHKPLVILFFLDDTSRVKLSNVDDDPCSDYINASYIPVSDSRMLFYSPPSSGNLSFIWNWIQSWRLKALLPLHLCILAKSLRTQFVGVLKGCVWLPLS